jgi:hypothetical protein
MDYPMIPKSPLAHGRLNPSPQEPGIPGGGAGRHRKSARIALLPLPSLLTHFAAESESLRATKEKLQEFGGKSLILMILIFAYFCHFGYTYISLGGVLKMDHVETAALYI